MSGDIRLVPLFMPGAALTRADRRTLRATRRTKRAGWWRRRGGAVTVPARAFEAADARAVATVEAGLPKVRFWKKELRLRRSPKVVPVLRAEAGQEDPVDRPSDDWFAPETFDSTVGSDDARSSEDSPRRRRFGRKAKTDQSPEEPVEPFALEDEVEEEAREESPRRRWFGRRAKDSDLGPLDEAVEPVALEDEVEEEAREELPKRRLFGRKPKGDDWAEDLTEPVVLEDEVEEEAREESPRRRWFGRKAKESDLDSVEPVALEDELEEEAREERPKRRLFGRKAKTDQSPEESVDPVSLETEVEEEAREEQPRRRLFGRKAKASDLGPVDEAVEPLALEDGEEAREEQPKRRWFGRKAKESDLGSVDEVVEQVALDAEVDEEALEEKPRRRLFGRKAREADTAVEVEHVAEPTPDAVAETPDRFPDVFEDAIAEIPAAELPIDVAPEPIAAALPIDPEAALPPVAEADSANAQVRELLAWWDEVQSSVGAADVGREPHAGPEAVDDDAASATEATETSHVADAPIPVEPTLPEPVAEVVEVEPPAFDIPAAVDPADTLGQTDDAAVLETSDPTPVEVVEPVAVMPEPVVVAPEPVVVAPEPVAVMPEPVDVMPEPVDVMPEPVDVMPEPVDVMPEPIEVAPEPVALTPEPVVVAPEPVAVEHEPFADAEAATVEIASEHVDGAKKKRLSLRRGKTEDQAERAPRGRRRSRKDEKAANAGSKSSRGVKKIVGLKVGASQLAAATIANNGSLELVQIAREPLEAGIVVGGELRDPQALAEALSEFFKKHKLPKKGVRLGLASNRIGVRSFEIVGIDDPKQLTNAVRFRAQDALPIPLGEAALDYQVLEESVDETGASVRRVLLVVVYRDLVERYIEACNAAGIKLVGIDLEAFAVLRALAPPRPEEVSPVGALVVVNVGHDRSTLAVSDGRFCEFTRVLDWGGSSLDVALARALNATPAEVAPLKRALDLDGSTPTPEGMDEAAVAKARDIVLEQINVFARELVSSLHFYQSQPDSLEIGEIVLTGGGSHLAGLASQLGQLTGVNVRVGDPLSRLHLKKNLETADPVGSLAVAIGLGIED